MRAIKTTTISILAVGLLAGSAVGVAAQDDGAGAMVDGDIVTPVPVTGTSTFDFADCIFDEPQGPTTESERFTVYCTYSAENWSVSDPRLEGEVTRGTERVILGFDGLEELRQADGDMPEVGSTGFTIRNDGGSWRERPRPAIWLKGTDEESAPLEAVTTIVLDGEGGYEGLVTVLEQVAGAGGTSPTFSGVIMDARLMPPVPENIAAE